SGDGNRAVSGGAEGGSGVHRPGLNPGLDVGEASMDDGPPPALEMFLAKNTEAWAELTVFMHEAEGWTLGFVEVNFPEDRSRLFQALAQKAQTQGWQVVPLMLDDPHLRYVRDRVVAELEGMEPPGEGAKRVVVIAGLERAIGMTGNEPPLLQDLNLLRDAYVQSVPHPLLVILPDFALNRLARFAPDFWAWRSGTFRFTSSEQARESAHEMRITGKFERFSSAEELKGRIDLLERLLQECCPTGKPQTKADRRQQIQILEELGDLYRDCGQFERAEALLIQGMALLEPDDLLNRKRFLEGEGMLYQKWQKHGIAIARYEAAIALAKSLENADEATRLGFQLGTVHLLARNFEHARTLYTDRLGFEQANNKHQDQARIYHQLGMVAQELREYEEARRNYQLALEINIDFGDRYSQARTYYQLAKVDEATSELEQARENYLQDLQITIEFNDEHGLGISLRNLARFYTETQDETLLTAAATLLNTTPDALRQQLTA
ncbi:MAG: tetratricopeptide repeat protein, partial [Cyanophyceae cyanobacterium]